ncbi:MAG: hypothetical protein JWN46_726 [Acidimicrobiales bacterium]|nr:hypothetical protein [Acidimicrobiales bacterium]
MPDLWPAPARIDPAFDADEPTMLGQYLDYHRATLAAKADGLTRDQLNQTTGASSLTLGSLLKHLALVEDTWFTNRFAGLDEPEPWASAPFDDDRDWDLHSAVDDEPAALLAVYADACDRSRAVVAASGALDQRSVVPSRHTGEPYTLRWILVHMIEETARHNGHADLLREAIDGETGV